MRCFYYDESCVIYCSQFFESIIYILGKIKFVNVIKNLVFFWLQVFYYIWACWTQLYSLCFRTCWLVATYSISSKHSQSREYILRELQTESLKSLLRIYVPVQMFKSWLPVVTWATYASIFANPRVEILTRGLSRTARYHCVNNASR